VKTKIISSEVTGSDNPEPVDVHIALVGEYPDNHQDSSPGWKAAWDHAARHENTPKACQLYADAHYHEHGEGATLATPEELQARIAELEAELAAKETPEEPAEETKPKRTRGKTT
jgi:hypothetical protein